MAQRDTGLSYSSPRRRSVLAGAAWAVPAVSVATSAPAMAASGPPAIVGNGTIVRNSCAATTSSPGAVTVTFDSRPSYTATTQPTSGFWVTNLPSGVSIVSATRTIYVDARFTNVAWSFAGTSSSQRQWSLPKLDTNAAALSGLVAYTSTYQAAAWTRVDTAAPTYAIASYGVYFNLSATTPATTCGGVFNFRNYRTTTLSNGTMLTNLKALATA